MTPLTLFVSRVIVGMATPTPEPVPAFTGDADLVTPGVIGFGVTFVIAVLTVLLVSDMTRRVRRVQYRAEVREQLEAEGQNPVSPTPEG